MRRKKIHVLLLCPFSNASGRVAHGAEQVASSHSCTVKDLHQDFRRYGLEHSRLGRWPRVIGAGRCGVKAVNHDFLVWGPSVNFDM
eukprot:8851136-Pyramimonas_sp.AAC.1